MDTQIDARLLVFTRAPIPGQVKTRLIPALGAVGAADLHRRMTEEVLRRLCALPTIAVELWITSQPSHPFFVGLAQRWPLELRVQPSGDLGARMEFAARAALDRTGKVILLGTDCPELSQDHMRTVIERLDDDDAVIGPAVDGGYVLLGLRRVAAPLFRDVPWGSDRVADITRSRLRALGWSWSELPPLHDIDRPSDLRHLEPGLRVDQEAQADSGPLDEPLRESPVCPLPRARR